LRFGKKLPEIVFLGSVDVLEASASLVLFHRGLVLGNGSMSKVFRSNLPCSQQGCDEVLFD
jgi:hypothetical protein